MVSRLESGSAHSRRKLRASDAIRSGGALSFLNEIPWLSYTQATKPSGSRAYEIIVLSVRFAKWSRTSCGSGKLPPAPAERGCRAVAGANFGFTDEPERSAAPRYHS